MRVNAQGRLDADNCLFSRSENKTHRPKSKEEWGRMSVSLNEIIQVIRDRTMALVAKASCRPYLQILPNAITSNYLYIDVLFMHNYVCVRQLIPCSDGVRFMYRNTIEIGNPKFDPDKIVKDIMHCLEHEKWCFMDDCWENRN